MESKKQRADILLVQKGLAQSREKAQALILAGKVLIGDRVVAKAGEKISEDVEFRLRGKIDHYVSRGAHKLKAAVDHFKIDLQNLTCLDVGASTGGFTQICLEAGASKVFATDVGHSQLDFLIRKDARVQVTEGVNFRTADLSLTGEKVDFICIDASFISLQKLLPTAKGFLKEDSIGLVALIKPQHEVGPDQVGKGGIVRDPALHERVKEEITQFAQGLGFTTIGIIESPITGTTGNKEFLIYLRCKTSK